MATSEPVRMVCANCGEDLTVPNSTADPGPCKCGCELRVTETLLGVVAPQQTLPLIGHVDLGPEQDS